MVCNECRKAGLTSVVYPEGTTSEGKEAQKFYDETGTLHVHNPSWNESRYRCSGGHHWTVWWRRRCPAKNCEFNTQEGIQLPPQHEQ